MYSVEMYVPVRRACMVEGRSVREAPRQRGHRGTRRCALRERSREDGPAHPAGKLRSPNPTPAAHRRYSTPKGSRQTCCSSSVGPGRCGGHPGAVDLRPADQPALHPEGQSPATPPHHPKQHREKPRLPEPNFIKPRGFQDDCFFRIFNSFKPTHEPSTWPTLPPPITGVPLSRTRRRWRNLPLRRRTCLAIPAARRSCLLRRPAHPW